ncbi:hypothetical protein [Moraxella boevrei]|uniref:hypothetical protein n=1 Tax=Faucicola boevrei TaxID=346665 RepID=UPI0037364960
MPPLHDENKAPKNPTLCPSVGFFLKKGFAIVIIIPFLKSHSNIEWLFLFYKTKDLFRNHDYAFLELPKDETPFRIEGGRYRGS